MGALIGKLATIVFPSEIFLLLVILIVKPQDLQEDPDGE